MTTTETLTSAPWRTAAVKGGRIIGDASTPGAEKYMILSANCTVATVYRSRDAFAIAAMPELLATLCDLEELRFQFIDGLKRSGMAEDALADVHSYFDAARAAITKAIPTATETTELWRIEPANSWPFPRANEIRTAGERIWLEISEDHREQLLGAVPPIYMPGGFMVGEASDFDRRRNATTYAGVVTVGDRHFLAEMTKGEWTEAVAALRKAIDRD